MGGRGVPGGLYGYWSGNWSRPRYSPPSYGVFGGPSRTKYHFKIFVDNGRAVMCGGASRTMLRNSLRRRTCDMYCC